MTDLNIIFQPKSNKNMIFSVFPVFNCSLLELMIKRKTFMEPYDFGGALSAVNVGRRIGMHGKCKVKKCGDTLQATSMILLERRISEMQVNIQSRKEIPN